MCPYYFTFGFAHAHAMNGVTYDKDCVVVIYATSATVARHIMVQNFGKLWAFQYTEQPDMALFPRGLFPVS